MKRKNRLIAAIQCLVLVIGAMASCMKAPAQPNTAPGQTTEDTAPPEIQRAARMIVEHTKKYVKIASFISFVTTFKNACRISPFSCVIYNRGSRKAGELLSGKTHFILSADRERKTL